MWKILWQQLRTGDAQQGTHGTETIQVWAVWACLYTEGNSSKTYADSHEHEKDSKTPMSGINSLFGPGREMNTKKIPKPLWMA